MTTAPFALLGLFVTALAVAAPPANEAPLLPAWLTGLAGTAEFSAERVEWPDGQATDVRAHLSTTDTGVELLATSPAFAGGAAEFRLRLDAGGESTLVADFTAIDLGTTGALDGYVRSLPVDARVRLTARGNGRQALLDSASGRIDLRSHGQGTIERGVDRAGASVFGALFDAFSPFRGEDDTSRVECMRARLDVTNGRASAPLLVQLWTRRMRLTGGGTVDLAAMRLDLHLTPVARQGIRIGGLNAVHDIALSGDFAHPEVTVDSGRLLQRAARLGTAVATIGGAAVIETLTARREDETQPCATLAARQADWP
ncbi:MAG: hypothetical protein AB7Q81_14545 [Gammaproteobacteria bacterium]